MVPSQEASTRADVLTLSGQALSTLEVNDVATFGARVQLANDTRADLTRTRAAIDRHASADKAVYGVNTGFGSLARKRIAPSMVREVQRNLLRSHAAAVGEPLDGPVVRAMMVILAASLARGRSGVRCAVVELLIELLNCDVTPVVPSCGSVGASGDLAPLAHLALVLIGEGEAWVDGNRMVGRDALRTRELNPISLEAKEGLALINGTHLMCAIGALSMERVDRLQQSALCAAAMAIDSCLATDTFLDARLHDVRAQPGQRAVAEALRDLIRGSAIVTSHKEDDPRVQDPYCLRAMPQVLGASWDAIAFARGVVERELGSVTDNPLVFDTRDGRDIEFVSGGNFHGMPLAIALDTLAIALCHVAGIAERRINWLLTASDSENPVSPYLSPQPGLHSGLMIAQYTAAACVNELQTLAAPASVGNIPTSAGIEDYNSMGATSARQVVRAVELTHYVVAIELLVMAEALEYHRPLRSSDSVERVHDLVRSVVPRLTEDRPPAPDIERIVTLIREGSFEKIQRRHS